MKESFPLGLVEVHRYPEPEDSPAPDSTLINIYNVGFVEIRRIQDEPDTALIDQFYINEIAQGNGLGSLLLDETAQVAREQGFTHIETAATNERTAHWFRRFTPERLTFYEYDEEAARYDTIDCDLEDVNLYLRDLRRATDPTSDHGMLARSICIRAKL